MLENNKCVIDLAKLAGDYWRLLRAYERLISESPQEKYSRLKSNHRNAERKLTAITEQNNIKIITYEGHEYTPNLPLSVVNSDEFGDGETLIISQTIEPTIMLDEQLLSIGKVILEVKG